MLILGRRDGQWISVIHEASGDTLRIRIFNVRGRTAADAPRCDLAFEDPEWHFLIDRPGRRAAAAEAGVADPGRPGPDRIVTKAHDPIASD